MKDSKVLKVILVIAGLIGILVGGANLFVPVAFNATAGLNLGTDVTLINEMKAAGGGILLSGIVIFLGVFMSRLAFTSTLLATILYLGYGFARILSMMVDGMPSDDFVQIAILEIVVGLVALYALYAYSENQTSN